MKILLVCAMDRERDAVASLLDSVSVREFAGKSCTCGRINGNEVLLAASGIGKVNAALAASALIGAFRPDALVSTGCAGGIDIAVEVMDFVAATECLYHDVDCGPGNELGQVQGLPPRFPSDERLLEAVRKAAASSRSKVHFGAIATGDRFITERDPLDAIKAAFPSALAVDMESAALAHTCHLSGVPFLSLRVISDAPGAKNRLAEYEDFWGTLAKRSFDFTREFLENL